MTLGRFNNTFLIVCIDDKNTINFYKNISLLRHSSFISFLKWFKFSDSYVCFFDSHEFIGFLKIYFEHIKISPKDGTNMILGLVYNGIFINIFNVNLIENLLFKYNYLLDSENLFLQLITVIIKFIEVFVFYSIDNLLLYIENYIFDL